MFCRCETGFGDAGEHAHVPGLPGAPGGAARAEPHRRSSGRSSSGSRSAPRSRRAPSSTGRTTSTRTARRATRSPSTTRRSASAAGWSSPARTATSRSGSSAPTSRRTRRRPSTSGGGTGRKVGAERSLIDFNRGGTPLVEIVTQPDIRSAEQAKRFLQLLRQTIVELGISDARMEEGTLRCDANVSVRPAGSDELRTRWELKNMNSFGFIGRGIEAAVRKQIELYEAGGDVAQETLRLRARHRQADAAPLEGGGGGLPLLPGARPRAARAGAGARRAAARRSCRSCRRI